MKNLLDECNDVEYRKSIIGYDVFTVPYMGWKGLKNGDLLSRAVADSFDVFLTTDRSVPYQQHLVSLPLAVIILHAATNDLADFQVMIPALLAALNHIAPHTVTDFHPCSKRQFSGSSASRLWSSISPSGGSS
jgi:hypothetical protein